MKSLFDFIIIGISFFVMAVGSKYTLKQTANYIQKLALTKIAQGLGDLGPATRIMTGF